jgi:hypothetical protein
MVPAGATTRGKIGLALAPGDAPHGVAGCLASASDKNGAPAEHGRDSAETQE